MANTSHRSSKVPADVVGPQSKVDHRAIIFDNDISDHLPHQAPRHPAYSEERSDDLTMSPERTEGLPPSARRSHEKGIPDLRGRNIIGASRDPDEVLRPIPTRAGDHKMEVVRRDDDEVKRKWIDEVPDTAWDDTKTKRMRHDWVKAPNTAQHLPDPSSGKKPAKRSKTSAPAPERHDRQSLPLRAANELSERIDLTHKASHNSNTKQTFRTPAPATMDDHVPTLAGSKSLRPVKAEPMSKLGPDSLDSTKPLQAEPLRSTPVRPTTSRVLAQQSGESDPFGIVGKKSISAKPERTSPTSVKARLQKTDESVPIKATAPSPVPSAVDQNPVQPRLGDLEQEEEKKLRLQGEAAAWRARMKQATCFEPQKPPSESVTASSYAPDPACQSRNLAGELTVGASPSTETTLVLNGETRLDGSSANTDKIALGRAITVSDPRAISTHVDGVHTISFGELFRPEAETQQPSEPVSSGTFQLRTSNDQLQPDLPLRLDTKITHSATADERFSRSRGSPDSGHLQTSRRGYSEAKLDNSGLPATASNPTVRTSWKCLKDQQSSLSTSEATTAAAIGELWARYATVIANADVFSPDKVDSIHQQATRLEFGGFPTESTTRKIAMIDIEEFDEIALPEAAFLSFDSRALADLQAVVYSRTLDRREKIAVIKHLGKLLNPTHLCLAYSIGGADPQEQRKDAIRKARLEEERLEKEKVETEPSKRKGPAKKAKGGLAKRECISPPTHRDGEHFGDASEKEVVLATENLGTTKVHDFDVAISPPNGDSHDSDLTTIGTGEQETAKKQDIHARLSVRPELTPEWSAADPMGSALILLRKAWTNLKVGSRGKELQAEVVTASPEVFALIDGILITRGLQIAGKL